MKIEAGKHGPQQGRRFWMERIKANPEGRWGEQSTKPGNDPEVDEDKEQGQLHDVIGHFGKYQLLIFMFKILIGVISAFNNLSVTFFAPSGFVGHWCADELATTSAVGTIGGPNGTAGELMMGVGPQSVESLANRTALPAEHLGGWVDYQQIMSDFLLGEERKHKHSLNLNHNTPSKLRKECDYLSLVDNKRHKCTSYRYDTGIWISSIIDEWDLVCDRAWFVSLTQSLYMSGFIVSFLVFGYISDRFGRWNSLLLGAIIEASSGFGCAFANSARVFMIFRFMLGLGNAGRASSSYLIMIEWAGPKWRMHVSTMGSLGWIIGYCAMPWLTIYFLHFRHMQLFVCFYEIVFILWLLRLPESPRWLLTHKRFNEAYEVLLTAAKFNGLITKNSQPTDRRTDLSPGNTLQVEPKTLAGDIESKATGKSSVEANSTRGLQPYSIEQFDVKFKRLVNTIYTKEFSENEHNLSVCDLFKWKNLRAYALILCFIWAANSFIYYGIALRVGDFGGKNLFISFTIAGLTELPSLAFTILCMKFLPRKTANIFVFTITGLLCIMQIPLKYYEFSRLQQAAALLAKLFNSCSFTIILYQTIELFPTSIRQTAHASCSLAGRVGSILAPFIKELAQVTNEFVPPVIYATLSLMTTILVTGLPETKGSDLPDTLLEAETKKSDKSKEGLIKNLTTN